MGRNSHLCSAVFLSTVGATFNAEAHVKWFAPYDISRPPLPVGEVITAPFLYLFLLSIVFIYSYFCIDRFLYRKENYKLSITSIEINEQQTLTMMRAATVIFFIALFVYGICGIVFFLTPELTCHNNYIPWLQLLTACFALVRPLLPLVGVNILILYSMGIHDYGVFHMLDYLIFVGVACYFLFANNKGVRWLTTRYTIMFVATGITLLWASIEKWSYPYWTYPLLEKNPSMLMGMSPEFYMIFAGFVEFNIAFILINSRSALARINALGLNFVFILAIFKFGLVDAVGHLIIISVLTIMFLRRPNNTTNMLVLNDKSIWVESYFMTGIYFLAFNMIFISYYVFYYLMM
jgi:hypothetical protein